MKTERYQRFFLAELVRFYESQKKHGAGYLEKLLALWKQQSGKAYQDAVRKLS